MAKDKKSFIAYCDWLETFEALPDDKAGQLAKHLFRYVSDLKPETDDILINAVFANIKQALKRDLKKYEGIRERNRENARKRWDAEKNKTKQKDATACDRIPKDTKNADSDNVSVSDNDNVNDINKETKDFFNSICINLPKIQKITKVREKAINARSKEYDYKTIGKVFKIASESNFLNGKNDKGWTADFDWILKPANFIKILEGNYNNKTIQNGKGATIEQIAESHFKHFGNNKA